MNNPLQNISIVGAGILGAQIAILAAHAGYQVKAYDPLENAFDETYDKIKRDMEAKNVKPLFPWPDWPKCKEAVHKTTNLDEAVTDADLIIEAAPENIELKNKVFKETRDKSKTHSHIGYQQLVYSCFKNGTEQRAT